MKILKKYSQLMLCLFSLQLVVNGTLLESNLILMIKRH
ncbi:hypothetical protein BpHYR1_018326 [Brachionus plicatilis]|uniref:Uncharacterized protein n=1 Tax=Brachionus plicatilis TaxID=10195 RepID=A0A3M7SPW2_BRAPC|nr:hypothetical protein BpHYR1_018326 [Brachionus plicatilis]